VTTADILVITTGANAGEHTIVSVDSETQLTVGDILSADAAMTYEIREPIVMTGTKSIKFNATATPNGVSGDPALQLDRLIPVSGSQVYRLTLATRSTVSAANISANLTFYKADKVTEAGSTGVSGVTTATNSWAVNHVRFRPNADARWAVLMLRKIKLVGETVNVDYSLVDRVTLTPDRGMFHNVLTVANSVPVNTWTNMLFNVAKAGTTLNWSTGAWTAEDTMTVSFHAQVQLTAGAVGGGQADIAIFKNTVIEKQGRPVPVGVPNTFLQVSIANLEVAQGDVIEVKVKHNVVGDTLSQSITTPEFNFVSASQMA
jgi:hypothetical protein